MRFWDASAIVPLLVNEAASERVETIREEDRAIVVWWASFVECASALSRLQRDGNLEAAGLRDAMARMRRLSSSWIEVPASVEVREQAVRLLRLHAIRAGDALQLAAAVVAADFRPDTLEFVTLDSRQTEAADREGFRVIS